jgi:hypothetical protein
MLAQTDPTDYALATIASILERPKRREAGRSSTDKISTDKISTDEPATEAPPIGRSPPPLPAEADGYSKIGPGPIAAIRFSWTVRRADDGHYFVDEVVGENSARTTTGPMAKDAAVKLVDDRESAARRRFEQLRGEMIHRGEA